MSTRTNTFAWAHTHTHTPSHSHSHVSTSTHAHTHTHMNSSTHTLSLSLTFTRKHKHAQAHTSIHTHAHIYGCSLKKVSMKERYKEYFFMATTFSCSYFQLSWIRLCFKFSSVWNIKLWLHHSGKAHASEAKGCGFKSCQGPGIFSITVSSARFNWTGYKQGVSWLRKSFIQNHNHL